jgi:hypothetical protein
VQHIAVAVRGGRGAEQTEKAGLQPNPDNVGSCDGLGHAVCNQGRHAVRGAAR